MKNSTSEKITEQRVMECMNKYVKNSEGTVAFLNVMRNATSPFLSTKLIATQSLRKIWHAVFFLRGWKHWCKHTDGVSMKNYITHNTYECVELNAHSFVNIMVKSRENEEAKFFMPNSYNS